MVNIPKKFTGKLSTDKIIKLIFTVLKGVYINIKAM